MEIGDLPGAVAAFTVYLYIADRGRLDCSRVRVARWLMIALQQLGRHEEASIVQADLGEYLREFSNYNLDALDSALGALLSAPAGSAGPVLAVS
jgi:hypothetical protein